MKKIINSLVLLICLFSGISESSLRNSLNFQQDNNLVQTSFQKSDNFPKPPYCGFGKKKHDLGKNSIKNGKNRIYGGVKVRKQEFPWMVHFTMGCGGTLINSRWVLSAAHCFHTRFLSQDRINRAVGHVNATNCDLYSVDKYCDPHAIKLEIKKIILHKEFDTQQMYNDIALIQIKNAVTFTDTFQPICLPYNNEATKTFNQEALVSGWGYTEHGHPSTHLLKASIRIWNADECEERSNYGDFSSMYLKNDLQICAGGIAGIDSCGGDSGGPLLLELPPFDERHKSKPIYQVGIVSFGPSNCGKKGWPGVYVNVSSYTSWIRDTILANE